MDLTPAQRQQLHTALLAAFPSWTDLRLFTDHSLDLNLATIATAVDLQTAALDLTTWARKEGRVAELIAAMGTARPQHPLVQACRAWFSTALSPAVPSPPPATDTAARDRLAARINGLDAPFWADLLTTLGLDPALDRRERAAQTAALLEQWATEGWPGLEAAVQFQVTAQATAQARSARDAEMDTLGEQGHAAYQKADWDTLIARGETLRQLGPSDSRQTSMLANGYYERATLAAAQQDYPAALADYTRAIALAEYQAHFYHARSTVYRALGQTAEAEADAAHAHQRNAVEY